MLLTTHTYNSEADFAARKYTHRYPVRRHPDASVLPRLQLRLGGTGSIAITALVQWRSPTQCTNTGERICHNCRCGKTTYALGRISHQTTKHHDIRLKNRSRSIVQNFINNDSEGTSNTVGICKLPEDGVGDSETCRSK
jgi:hypothetical protein